MTADQVTACIVELGKAINAFVEALKPLMRVLSTLGRKLVRLMRAVRPIIRAQMRTLRLREYEWQRDFLFRDHEPAPALTWAEARKKWQRRKR
jgi:hypothetical protein